jgi:hypothetical protein
MARSARRYDLYLPLTDSAGHPLPMQYSTASSGGWLASLYVRADRRRRGVGGMLLKAAVAEARRLGVKALYLFTADQEGYYGAGMDGGRAGMCGSSTSHHHDPAHGCVTGVRRTRHRRGPLWLSARTAARNACAFCAWLIPLYILAWAAAKLSPWMSRGKHEVLGYRQQWAPW